MITIPVTVEPGGYQPVKAHESDAGFDLKTPETFWVHPSEHVTVDLRVHMLIPEGHVGLITSKSGLMAKGLTSRGTVDAGYTGSIRAVIYNHGKEGYKFVRGDKVTQIVILPLPKVELAFVDKLEETERGDGGFGSTGK